MFIGRVIVPPFKRLPYKKRTPRAEKPYETNEEVASRDNVFAPNFLSVSVFVGPKRDRYRTQAVQVHCFV